MTTEKSPREALSNIGERSPNGAEGPIGLRRVVAVDVDAQQAGGGAGVGVGAGGRPGELSIRQQQLSCI